LREKPRRRKGVPEDELSDPLRKLHGVGDGDLTGVLLSQEAERADAKLVDDRLEVELEGTEREVADVCQRETRAARVEPDDHPITGEPFVPRPGPRVFEVRLEGEEDRLREHDQGLTPADRGECDAEAVARRRVADVERASSHDGR
jgi:hypothetical protein